MVHPDPQRTGPSLQEALELLGAKRVEAILVAALVEGRSLGTREIVERTGLRQPEVSVGMQSLHDRGWVETETMHREGKGRPMNCYRLAVLPAELRRHYESAGEAGIAAYRLAMDTLAKHLR